jgi:hypothetical protein
VATIERHLVALEKYAPEMLALYKDLGRFTIPIGREKGTLAADKAEAIEALLKR